MLLRRPLYRMSRERFDRWFDDFKKPYTQEKFINSYRSLENSYSELVIKNLLTMRQRRQVERFISRLPKMNDKRFRNFLVKLKKDSGILHKYSYKDFTPLQKYIICYYLSQKYLKERFHRIWT
jgi:hypothetical protein